MAIIGMLAATVIPRMFMHYEPPLRSLQRAVAEVSDMAMDGINVRFRMEPRSRSDRGPVVVEGLAKVEDARDPEKYTLEWIPLKMKFPLAGEEWRLEPEIVYFYADGTCTPARIIYADKDTSLKNGESALLTVTGYLFDENAAKKK